MLLEGRTCVVCGSGPAADARVASLTACGAAVRRLEAGDVGDDTLTGAFLVIIEHEVEDADARTVASAAHACHALVYAVDRTALSDLALPAVARRGLLSVAVSTSGASPVLARLLRDELEGVLPEELAALTERLGALRDELSALPREERAARLREALEGLHLEGRLTLPGPDRVR